jgi:hypothetical protein
MEDGVKLAAILREWHPDILYCEDVNGFGMGATSSFSFGRGTGVIDGVTSAVLGQPATLVAPQTWKGFLGILVPKKLGASKSAHKEALKAAAITKAQKLFPGRVELAHDGCAEAVLIGTYAVLKIKGLRA